MTNGNGGKIPKLTQIQLTELAKTMQKREEALVEMEKVNNYSTVSIQQTYINNQERDKVITSVPRPASVIEFDMDSKGKVKPRVKVYHENPQIAFDLAVKLMEQAKQKAMKLSE